MHPFPYLYPMYYGLYPTPQPAYTTPPPHHQLQKAVHDCPGEDRGNLGAVAQVEVDNWRPVVLPVCDEWNDAQAIEKTLLSLLSRLHVRRR